MHTTRGAQVLALLVLVVLAAVSAACSAAGTAPGPVRVVAGPLLTVETRGGKCFNAPCGSTITIERDGRVHLAANPPDDLGTVPADQLAALDSAIKLTDFAALGRRPFAGECPMAFDGQEVIYVFWAPTGTERIASCETAIDPGSPLFVAVAAALGSLALVPAIRTDMPAIRT